MATARKKPAKAEGETRTVEYAAPGVKPDVQREEPSIDAELLEIRDAEAKANDVPINPAPGVPTIDDALVKARDEEIKRLGGKPQAAPKATAEKSAPSKNDK